MENFVKNVINMLRNVSETILIKQFVFIIEYVKSLLNNSYLTSTSDLINTEEILLKHLLGCMTICVGWIVKNQQ